MNLKDFSKYIIMEDNDKPLINVEEDVVLLENNKWNGGICDCFNNMYPSMICSFLTPYIHYYVSPYNKKKLIYNPIFVYLSLIL